MCFQKTYASVWVKILYYPTWASSKNYLHLKIISADSLEVITDFRESFHYLNSTIQNNTGNCFVVALSISLQVQHHNKISHAFYNTALSTKPLQSWLTLSTRSLWLSAWVRVNVHYKYKQMYITIGVPFSPKWKLKLKWLTVPATNGISARLRR